MDVVEVKGVALDSGAHSLYERIGKKDDKFFESDIFWDFVDRYAEYMKRYKDRFDFYVNVDVIFNPRLSWRVQRYLEREHGLNPLPVFHWGEDLRWLKRYMDNYEYIGVGGLGQTVTKRDYVVWGDKVFSLVGRSPWKVHGFAMTSVDLMLRYPWFSVDSSSWIKLGAYGKVLVEKEGGRTVEVIFSSVPFRRIGGVTKHFSFLSSLEREFVERYIETLGREFSVNLSVDSLADSSYARIVANALFLQNSIVSKGIRIYFSGVSRHLIQGIRKFRFPFREMRFMGSFYYLGRSKSLWEGTNDGGE